MNQSIVIRGRGLGEADSLSKKKRRSVEGVGHIAGDFKNLD